jgi:predicted NBD/HSP70 family sugar kinase
VLQLAVAGDAVAQQLVTEAVGGWALAIATTCGTVDPGAVLIGGGIAEDIGPYLDPLCRLVDELVPGRAPRIEVANLASLAGLVGAGVAARHSTTAQGLPTPSGSVIRQGAQVSSTVTGDAAKSLNE